MILLITNETPGQLAPKLNLKKTTNPSRHIPTSKQPFRINRTTNNASLHPTINPIWTTQQYKEPKNHNSDQKQKPQSNVTTRNCSPYGQQGPAWCDDLSDILPFVIDVSSACDVPHVAATVGSDLLDASGSSCHFGEV